MIHASEIHQFTEHMQNILIAKELLGEKYKLKVEFEIADESRYFKVDCNKNRIMMNLHLKITDDTKLINKLKYYLRNRKDLPFNSVRKSIIVQKFEFSFNDYQEFLEFYNKYLLN